MDRATDCTIITDQTALGEAFVPNRLPVRDAQSKEIALCLSPLLQRRQPVHLWLHGKPGAGKTASVVNAMNALRDKGDVQGVLVDCWQKATFFEVIDDIVTQLCILRAEEHRTTVKLDKLRRHLKGRPFLIVLDDIDHVAPAERAATICNLQSIANVGLVCISGSEQAFLELDSRVKSRLNPYIVGFPSYTQDELVEILRHRAGAALAYGCYSDDVLTRIACMAAGDARIAVGTLRMSAELSEASGKSDLFVDDIERQRQALHDAVSARLLQGLTEDHGMLYRIVKERGEILSGDLWREYLRRCAEAGRKPLAARTFSNYANRLVQAGLMAAEQARTKGKVRLFRIVTGNRGTRGTADAQPS